MSHETPDQDVCVVTTETCVYCSQDAERFQAWRVEKTMLEVLSERLRDVTYDAATCQTLAKDLSAEIQRRVKEFRWNRYRVVCQVQTCFVTHYGTVLWQQTGKAESYADSC